MAFQTQCQTIQYMWTLYPLWQPNTLFINCEKTKDFWNSWTTWSLNLTGYNILDNEFLVECLLFGFPGNSNNARLIKFCTLYAKYFIYTDKIKGNNNFEFLCYIIYQKHVLMIETRICITKHQQKSFPPLNIVLGRE